MGAAPAAKGENNMLLEFIYIAIVVVIGILKWQQARTTRERAIAVLAAVLWPATYLIQELSRRPDIYVTKTSEGDK